MSLPQFEEIQFKVRSNIIAAKRWNKGARYQVIALHGWLDNCGSFDPMAVHFNDIDLVALDSAGHALSDDRSMDSPYLVWSDVAEIVAVADQLGWEKFNLLGHSRGAGIAAISSGTFPERIIKLALIEGGVPFPLDVNEAPENLAKHILDDAELAETKGTLFNTREEAITARANGFTKISEASAEILAIRALREEEGGYRWRADQRLKVPSALKLTRGQIGAFLGRIQCPVLVISADKGIIKDVPSMAKHLLSIKDIKQIELAGGHHLHMEDSAKDCAIAVEAFLATDNTK